MSRLGAYLVEMRLFRQKTRPEVEITEPQLAAFADELRSVFLAEIPEETSIRHLSAIVSELSHPAPIHFKVPVLRRLRNSLTMKVAAATAVLVGATGGLAWAGALPDAMQEAVSNAAVKAGLDIPSGQGIERQAEHGSGGSEASKSVKNDVLDAVRSEYDSGREKGDAVSDAASQNRKSEDLPNSGTNGAATDDPPASGRPDDPQDQGRGRP